MSEPAPSHTTLSVLQPGSPGPWCGSVEYLDFGPPADRLPFGAAVVRAGETASGSVVLVLSGQATADPAECRRAVSILAGRRDIGAVVPRVLWPDGSLAEAGAMIGTDGTMVSCGAGESPQRSEHRFRRAVDGTRFGCVAVRRSLIADAGLDPELDQPTAVVSALLAQLRAGGHGILFEPRWSITAGAGPDPASDQSGRVGDAGLTTPLGPSTAPRPAGHRRAAMRDAHAAQRILVVTGTLSGRLSPGADDGVMDLVSALHEACPLGRLVVACAEGSGRDETAAWLRAAGIEVQVGPGDWSQWFAEREYHFSHVIVTDGGLLAGLGRYALDSQPQAAKILSTTTLAFRAVEGMLPVTPYLERIGHEYVRATVAVRTSEIVRRFDSVWCGSVDDHQYLSGLLSDIPVRLVIRPAGARLAADRGYPDRWGMAVVALDGADIVAGHEDAAMSAAEEIFSRLYRRDSQLRLAVITDKPSPMIGRLAGAPGVHLVRPGIDGGLAALAQARVVLAPYRHGLGGPAVLWAALTARTPVLTTSYGARGFMLGDLAAQAVVDDPLDLVERAWILHHDRDAWDQHRAGMDSVIRAHHEPSRYRSTVAAALLELGVAPARSGPAPGIDAMASWPDGHRVSGRLPLDQPALRPGEAPRRVTASVPDGVPEIDGYHLWCETRGPTPVVLERLKTELVALDYRPKISIVTPVYNTDPALLEATLASVRDQIYPNWEHCLADDGSTRADTKLALERAAEDPRVKVVRLAGQSGISGASNAALALASGDYVTMVDHDDLLKPHALAQVVRWLNHDPTLDVLYSDEDKLDESGRLVEPYLKPDWSPDLLMSRNYVNHLLVVRKFLMDKLGGFRSEFDGSQDYDLVLRLCDETDRIGHIPEPLYTWRRVEGSTAAEVDAKPYALQAAERALTEALRRRGQSGTVEGGLLAGTYRTRYQIPGTPRVAIIIPTRDRVELLRRCVDSIVSKTEYRNYQIVVIDNESQEPATLEYLATFPGRVVRYPATFNYARMLNLAVHSIDCDALLFLNNDTEVINRDWIGALLEHAMRPEVGAVGCRLYYPDGRLQHEGILVGILGVAANIDHGGFWGLGDLVRDCSAVTGACVMMRPAVYWAVGGNDERLRVAYNDVDICLRIRQAGYQVVYTPYAQLYHFEGASRAGYEHSDDKAWFSVRWRQFEEWDPYYSPNYDRGRLFRMAL